jgi:xylulokinase
VRDVLCGVDIGTTHVKAVLVAADGTVLSVAKVATPVIKDGHGPCHDPEAVRDAAEQVMVRAQVAAPEPTRVTAIGVTSVGEEGVPLGASGELLYPSIAWYERRPSAAERAWSDRHDDEELFAVTGVHKDLGFTLFKWLWLKEHQPAVWAGCRWWLGIGDYVIWRWTGARAMSVSHAGRTGILDLRTFEWRKDWAAEVLAQGVDALPSPHEAGSVVGLLPGGAIPGLVASPDAPVVVTGLDHAVGAYAAGVARPGQLMNSMGTAEALIEPVPARYLDAADYALGVDFGPGILPRTHIVIAGFASGAGVAGMRRTLGATSAFAHAQLEQAATELPAGADGLIYVPPRTRSTTGGAFIGHQVTHGPAHLYRAVVEGWSLAADHALATLAGMERLRDVVCIGGGSRSALWTRVKASLWDREISCVTTPEMVAVGAALLAGKAVPGTCVAADWRPDTETVAPVPEWVAAYRPLREEFTRRATAIHGDAGPHVYP